MPTPIEPVRSSRLTRVLRALDYRSFSRRTQMAITVLGSVVFAIGAALSWYRLDLSLSGIQFVPLLIVLVTGPLPILLSAAEFRTTARGLNDPVGWTSAVDIALVGYAANLLPVPGGALVRISTLTGQAQSGSPRNPTYATMAVGVAWLGSAVLVAGLALLGLREIEFGVGFCVVGGFLIIASAGVARRFSPEPSLRRFFQAILAVELAFVGIAALRTYFAFLAFDIEVSVGAALVVAASSAMSTAVGIVPSGLGIREGLAALLAGLSGLAPSTGFLASVLLRVAGMLTAGALSGVRLFTRRSDPKASSAPEVD